MSAVAAIVAFPVAALTIWVLLRNGLGGRFVATPSDDRWHEQDTPSFGGVGIFLGLLAGIGACLLTGAVDPTWELAGIAGGAAIVFAFGLVDDLRSLPPPAKLAGQFAAAGVVIASGIRVEIVDNGVVGTALGLLWLVAITNAFNLLDNMDGLAGSLAVVGALFFAIDAVWIHSDDLLLVVSLALALAVAGFLPYNFRPRKPAAVFMGDSGSQVIGLDARGARPGDELEGRGVDGGHADHPAARARDPDPRHGARDRRAPRRGPADPPGRPRPRLPPTRAQRHLREGHRRPADGDRRRARPDQPRLLGPRQQLGDARRRARDVRAARAAGGLPDGHRRGRDRGRRQAGTAEQDPPQPAATRGGRRRLRTDRRLVHDRLPAVRGRVGHRLPEAHLPRLAAGDPRRALPLLHPGRALQRRLALRRRA